MGGPASVGVCCDASAGSSRLDSRICHANTPAATITTMIPSAMFLAISLRASQLVVIGWYSEPAPGSIEN
jgi:hypothetical protein